MTIFTNASTSSKAQGLDGFLSLHKAGEKESWTVMDLLQHLGYPQESSTFLKAYAQALGDPTLDIILAKQDTQVLGLISLRTVCSLRLSGLLTSIEELVVHPQYRGMGIGGCLLAEAQMRAKCQGAVLLEVHTTSTRESFKREFYIKHGFTQAQTSVFRWNPS